MISVEDIIKKIESENFDDKFKQWLVRDGLSQGWEYRLFEGNKNWAHWCVLHEIIEDEDILWYYCKKFPIYATQVYVDRLDDKKRKALFKLKDNELTRRKSEEERMTYARRSN